MDSPNNSEWIKQKRRRRGRPPEITPKHRAEFLKALEENAGNVTIAAKVSGVSRTEWYRIRDEEPAFRAEWDAALQRSNSVLIDEAIRRASAGTDKPVFYAGKACGSTREYSDT